MVCFFRNQGFNLQIGLFSSQAVKEVTEEAVIFNEIDLVASIGGYLGLFLGASILSIYQLLVDMGRKFVR